MILMDYINIDFETRSVANLRGIGVWKYVEHPTTDIWCMAYNIDGDTQLWIPGDDVPGDLLQALGEGWGIRAWNAAFEYCLWNYVAVDRYWFPKVPLNRFYCTQADAMAMGLSGTLAKDVEALRLPIAKDMPGNRLAIQMAKPRKLDPLTWWDDIAKRAHLYEYCKLDVDVEMAAQHATRRISLDEREVWLADMGCNRRGVHVDMNLVRRSRAIALEGTARANTLVAVATGGKIHKITQTGALQFWLNNEMGVDIPNLRKTTVQEYLGKNIPQEALDALSARADAGKASIAKIDKMLAVAGKGDRLRGLTQYHGAATGRWAGRLVQPQNFPRGTVAEVTSYILSILKGSTSYDLLNLEENPVALVSSLLRSMLDAAPGHRLLAGDFSAVEARVLAWVAGQQDLLDAFERGEDVYATTGADFGVDRQIGKVTILGAGFQMGGDKFEQMGTEMYGIDWDSVPVPDGVSIEGSFTGGYTIYHGEWTKACPTESNAKAHAFIRLYRERFAEIKNYWSAAEQAVLSAVSNPGSTALINKNVKVGMRGRQLWIVLPSGRPLCYLYPTIVERKTPWGQMKEQVRVLSFNSTTKKFNHRYLYGGLITENIVQAVARDLMASAWLRLEAAGYPIVLTVHDELVAEREQTTGSYDEFIALMSESPTWAKGLPIKASGWEGQRYRKG